MTHWIILAPPGFTTTPTPLYTGVAPLDFPDTGLWSTALPPGTVVTIVFALVDGATVPALDVITGVVP